MDGAFFFGKHLTLTILFDLMADVFKIVGNAVELCLSFGFVRWASYSWQKSGDVRWLP